MKHIVLTLTIFLLSLGGVSIAWGAMSSMHYEIDADYIGVGGAVSTSTNFSLSASVAGLAVGVTSSTSYQVQAGFISNDGGSISLVVNTNSVNLGELSTAAIKSGEVVVTVTTDQSTGFTLSIESLSGGSPHAVSDGAVSVGSEEYGIAATGAHSQLATDAGIATGLVLASASVPVTNDATTLVFKASISPDSASATYSQTIALAAATNF